MNRIKTFDEFTNIVDSNITGDFRINFIDSNSSALDKENNEVNYTAILNGLDFFLEYFNGDNYDKPRVYFHTHWNRFARYDWERLAKLKTLVEQVMQVIKELEE